MRRLKKALWLYLLLPIGLSAQINTERVMLMGRNALYYEDYVLSIQRFNMVIAAKPYLSEPYFFRGLAKFYLEDYMGAEEDCGEAIARNPFLPDNYRLRGLCRINLHRYQDAVDDYVKLLEIEPKDESAIYNKVLCHLELKQYAQAREGLDVMARYWPKKTQAYTLKAQSYFAEKDTVAALACVDQALEVDAYDGQAWNMRAAVYAKRGEYAQAEEALDKTIRQMPREPAHYINRALARYQQRKLQGAMDDYDTAIELDSTSLLGHFNRGLLRAQVGDDNRAIEDFDYVLRREPTNTIALFNRALMRKNTGDYRGALADINTVIKDFPTFWTGYSFRAEVKRALGDVNGAERDEFKVMKAQMDKRFGHTAATPAKTTRVKGDESIEDYDKLVVEADTAALQNSYDSEYRGKVQYRKADLTPEPALALSYYRGDEVFRRRLYSSEVEALNGSGQLPHSLLLTHAEATLDARQIQQHFESVQELSSRIESQPGSAVLHFARGIDEYLVQDFESARRDASKALVLDSTFVLARMLRVQTVIKECQALMADGGQSQQAATKEKWEYDKVRLDLRAALDDCDILLATSPQMAGSLYNKGNIYLLMQMWPEAEAAYTKALQTDGEMAEAYYNRGLVRIHTGRYDEAVADLNQAGERGLYKAYNLIRRYGGKKAGAK